MAYSTGVAGTNITIANGAGYQTYSASGITTPTSFLPVIAFGGASTGVTYLTQTGTYQQLSNNLIYFSGLIELSSKGSSTGSATVNLPHTSSNTLATSLLNIYCINLNATFASTFIGAQINQNTTNATIAKGSGITSAAMTDADFTNTSAIYYNGCYFI